MDASQVYMEMGEGVPASVIQQQVDQSFGMGFMQGNFSSMGPQSPPTFTGGFYDGFGPDAFPPIAAPTYTAFGDAVPSYSQAPLWNYGTPSPFVFGATW